MEKKTFAFKLADQGAKAPRKWTAREGVALAGCTELPTTDYKQSFRRADDSIFC